jgi:two-component system nitrogen regulation sensor histidine kinase NtrY
MDPTPPPARPLPPPAPPEADPAADPARVEGVRRRRERTLILVTGVSIALLVSIQILLSQAGRATLAGASNLLVYGFINVNVILMLLLMYLVIRNFVKLLLERRQRVLGSRLRTRLVTLFVLLSLAPTIALFAVAAVFVRSSINNWFLATVEDSLAGSLDVAEAYYETGQERAVFHARGLGRAIADQRLHAPENTTALETYIARKQAELNLAGIEVWSARRALLASVADPSLLPAAEAPRAPREGYDGVHVGRLVPSPQGGVFIRGIAPIRGSPGDEVAGVVVASLHVPRDLVQKVTDIRAGFDEYKGLKILKQPIKSSYVLTLLLVTLLIMLCATWFGFRLAKELTGPVQALAEGTRRVAEGDLDFRLDVRSDDEIGMLVDSFNRMTTDLRTSKAQLTRANVELRASNVEIERRRAYMEIVLRSIGAGVIALDREGVVTAFNHAAERLLGLEAPQVVGRPYREAFTADETALVRSLIHDLGHAGTDAIERQVKLAVGDRTLTLLVSVTLLRDERQHYVGLVVVFEDLTEVVKVQRMSAWREVARRIAHEIKNPLTPIQLSAQRLRRRYMDKVDGDGLVFDECTSTIIKQVEELKGLVDEFSTFARLPAASLRPSRLDAIVREALALYREAHKSIAFRFDEANDLPVLDLDADQMKRVLINLFENAVAAILGDAAPAAAGAGPAAAPAGEITVTTRYDAERRVARLEVADSGCGIPADIRPRLFEPYFSTKKNGTGLGLAIVSTIVADHNGYIRVKDNEPRGTRFVIELPVRP